MVARTEQEQIRIAKLAKLRAQRNPFPNDTKVEMTIAEALELPLEDAASARRVTVAGRLMRMRAMGKATFAHLQDRSAMMQIYVRKDDIGAAAYAEFGEFDLGDIVEVRGFSFVTKTGERSLHVESIRLLVKALIPPPEKWHGLQDSELRYRHRHLDLISNPEVREIFRKRVRIIKFIRNFLDERGYLDVETPVLEFTQGGTTAKPFRTHYNALGCDMILRIALELPLKKLVVGGFERVYAIGTVFRNEGISKKHNPEFTMLEFYQAYATYHDLIRLTEELFSGLALEITGSYEVPFGDNVINFKPPYRVMSMRDSLHEIGGVGRDVDLRSLDGVHSVARAHRVELQSPQDWGKSLESLFGALVEPRLINPTFITHHPLSISPLARRCDDDPMVVDRFELFISGMETANAFSELNDPEDQRARFEDQVKLREQGDEEACEVDEDFLHALEVGLPPTAGQGIGVDRLTMILTNQPTIREVVLFPALRPSHASIDDQAEE